MQYFKAFEKKKLKLTENNFFNTIYLYTRKVKFVFLMNKKNCLRAC